MKIVGSKEKGYKNISSYPNKNSDVKDVKDDTKTENATETEKTKNKTKTQ